ncbi:hypothetical protein U8335_09890 [Roseiconus lacunae]|uniref:hypothetical protein n=1 Tax=Roseiconus lacunae TaxID=2605694 RepID=UPI00308D304C|nr:hypothetical protein U8335_09890 [Stieleria sp. HD01]
MTNEKEPTKDRPESQLKQAVLNGVFGPDTEEGKKLAKISGHLMTILGPPGILIAVIGTTYAYIKELPGAVWIGVVLLAMLSANLYLLKLFNEAFLDSLTLKNFSVRSIKDDFQRNESKFSNKGASVVVFWILASITLVANIGFCGVAFYAVESEVFRAVMLGAVTMTAALLVTTTVTAGFTGIARAAFIGRAAILLNSEYDNVIESMKSEFDHKTHMMELKIELLREALANRTNSNQESPPEHLGPDQAS